MSLLCWYPFNGTLENIGIEDCDIINHGASINTSGKIGSCYSFNGSSNYMTLDTAIVNHIVNDFTICCWVKITSWSYNEQAVWTITGPSAAWADAYATFARKQASHQLAFSISNGTSQAKNACSSTDIQIGEWYHFACCYKSGVLQLYQNGVLQQQVTTSIIPAVQQTSLIQVGKWGPAYYGAMHMNDFRIYDECLSQKEIKEISKALILHYPMNQLDGFIGGRNLWRDTTNDITEVSSSVWGHQLATYTLNQLGLVPGDTITASVEYVDCEVPMQVMLTVWDNNNSYTQPSGNTIAAGQSGKSTLTYTLTSADTGIRFDLRYITSHTTAHTIKYRGVKLEKGSVATPWTPAPEDGVCTSFDNTIYDTSGYGNNGTTIADEIIVHDTTTKTSSSYNCATYVPSHYLIPNKRYKCTICVTPAAGTQKYAFQLSRGYTNNADFPVSGTSKQIITKELTGGYYAGRAPEDNPANSNIQFYRLPNDGTVTGASTFHWCRVEEIGSYPSWSNDTVIGQGSYLFDGTTKYIDCGYQQKFDEFTISIWCKTSSLQSGKCIVCCADSSGWEIWGVNSMITFSTYCSDSDVYKHTKIANLDDINDNQFHLITAVYDKGDIYTYFDGILQTQTSSLDQGIISYNNTTHLFIGGEANGTNCSPRFNGCVNDFRMYATALSANDIKELYETRYSIADNGTLFCDSIKEETDIDLTNLVFNGDLKYVNGTEAKGFTQPYNSAYGGIRGASDGFGCQTKVPLKPGCTYRYTFDYYIASWNTSKPFYMAIRAYDNRNSEITITQTNRVGTAGDTTLAAPLNNGDTTATIVTSSAINTAWSTYAVHQYSKFCTFRNLAWGYNKATEVGPRITGYSNGVVTLASAWSGGAMPAGVRVGITRDGNTYVYPYHFTPSQNDIGKWKTVTGTFTPNSRYSMSYAQPYSLNYNQEVYFKNIRIENITETQLLNVDNYREANLSDTVKFLANGQLSALCIDENDGMDIRYIRDYLNGSTANTYNHWVEIQAYNDVGNNCCWGLTPTSSAPFVSVRPGGLITDGNTASSPYAEIGGGGNQYVQIDLQKVRNIKQLKIWHYWADGRQYNNKTQVSADGTTWITVFDSDVEGKYVETADGHTIDLTDKKFKIYSNGAIHATEIIEH